MDNYCLLRTNNDSGFNTASLTFPIMYNQENAGKKVFLVNYYLETHLGTFLGTDKDSLVTMEKQIFKPQ